MGNRFFIKLEIELQGETSMLQGRARSLLGVTVATILIMGATMSYADDHGFVPKDGFVPDSSTAISIAEAVLIPIYGRERIESQKPFQASLQGSEWTVTGTLEQGFAGGVAEVVIDKMTGRIIKVEHGR